MLPAEALQAPSNGGYQVLPGMICQQDRQHCNGGCRTTLENLDWIADNAVGHLAVVLQTRHWQADTCWSQEDIPPPPPPSGKETPSERAERLRREEIRKERARERERERRLEAKDAHGFKKSKLTRDRDRDVSEKMALGQVGLCRAGFALLETRGWVWRTLSRLCCCHGKTVHPASRPWTRSSKPVRKVWDLLKALGAIWISSCYPVLL